MKRYIYKQILGNRYIFLLFLFVYNTSYGQTYYFANDGDDSYSETQAQDPSTPWQTLEKLSSLELSPGATILFKKGDTWRGQIRPSTSGEESNLITYSTYGEGDKPIISGSVIVSGWTLHEGNIYKATVAERVEQVFIGNNRKQLARHPNEGYLPIGNVEDEKTFSSDNIDYSIDWKGGKAHFRSRRWTFATKSIVSSNSTSISLNAKPRYGLKENWGYYINNKLEALDYPGEWYYDRTDKLLYFWAPNGENPDTYQVEAAITKRGFYVNDKDYIKISGFHIRNHIIAGIELKNSSNIIMEDNLVQNIDRTGIGVGKEWSFSGSNNVIRNNIIKNANHSGIESSSHYALITQNEIYNTGLFENLGASGTGDRESSSMGITVKGDSIVVSENRIDSSGYIGIHFYWAPNAIIEYNYVTNSCLTTDDGAGIYTFVASYEIGNEGSEGSIIRNNIVTDTRSAIEGTNDPNYFPGEGIYVDGASHSITVIDNTVANCANFGLFMNAGKNCSFIGNTSYNNPHGQIHLNEFGIGSPNIADVQNITMVNNIFYSLESSQVTLDEGSFKNDTDFFEGGGKYDSNYYCNPYKEANINKLGKLYTLKEWQEETGQEANSHKSILEIIWNEDPLKQSPLFLNPSMDTIVIDLGNVTYNDLDGNEVSDSIVLSPFGSIILTYYFEGERDETPPVSPANLAASLLDFVSVDLDWDDNIEDDFRTYTLRRATSAGGPYTIIASGLTESDYMDIGLPGLTTYYYVVSAFDIFLNESDISNEESVTTEELSLPEPRSFYDFEDTGNVVEDLGAAENNGILEGDEIFRIATCGIVSSDDDGFSCIELTGFPTLGRSYVNIPFVDFHNSPNYTYSAWVKYRYPTDEWGYLFWQNGNETEKRRHVDMWWDLRTQVVSSVLHDELGHEVRIIPEEQENLNVFDGKWHHVAISLENDSIIKIWEDGREIAREISPESIALTQSDLWIGCKPESTISNAVTKMIGYIDRVRIYDTALSISEMAYLYNSETPYCDYTAVEEVKDKPMFVLEQNIPNPFNNETTISYYLKESGQVMLQIIDVLGNVVATLVNETKEAGSHDAIWRPNTFRNELYFYKIVISSSKGIYSDIKKMIYTNV